MFITYQRKTPIKILILKREKINRANDESLKQNLRSCSEFFICVYCRLPTSDLL